VSYIIKRKFRGLLGDDVDNSQIATFVQHIQSSGAGLTLPLTSTMDTLIVNHLIVKRTLKISARTDGYK